MKSRFPNILNHKNISDHTTNSGEVYRPFQPVVASGLPPEKTPPSFKTKVLGNDGGLRRAFPVEAQRRGISKNKNYPVKIFNIRNYDLGLSNRHGHNHSNSGKEENLPEVQGFLLSLDSRGIGLI